MDPKLVAQCNGCSQNVCTLICSRLTKKNEVVQDLSPNCSTLPCHLVPSNGLSSECTDTILYALLMSNFASSVPIPTAQISAAMLSTDMYDSERKAG